jgi:sulfotransferase family protein
LEACGGVNPYVFLVGCPRSGTTLLRRICDAHPELAVIHQTRWIPRTFELRRGLTPEGFITPKLLEHLRDPRRLRRLEIEGSELERLFRDRGAVPFASFVTAVFDLYGKRHGDKRFVGDKTPGYVRYLPLLHELWPQAKFVHIIRDGRDVSLSVREWGKGAVRLSTFRVDPVTTTAVWWEWYVRLGLEGAAHVDAGLCHELRYEALVADPERECVELDNDGAMLRFHEGRTRSTEGLSSKDSWLPVTRGLRDWRTAMDADDVIRFEAAAGGLLEELGYERRAASVPRRDVERAERIRDRFAEERRARGRPLPRAWEAVRAQ